MALLRVPAWVAAVATAIAAGTGADAHDASALVQRSLQAHRSVAAEAEKLKEADGLAVDEDAEELEDLEGEEEEEEEEDEEKEDAPRFVEGQSFARDDYLVGDSVRQHPLGPVAQTKLGPILGVAGSENYDTFLSVPYAEKPGRFEIAGPKQPWAPKIYDATALREVCVGSDAVGGRKESEDCLTLDMWVPKGGHKNMPVLIYFHGGINQHGAGGERLRRGEGIANSTKYPAIFLAFNWRLGILGWISLPGSSIPENLGLHDQQALMRWVHEHISAFGGNPASVTLVGTSEGCGAITTHLVAPGSAGLFNRAVLFSSVADFWSRNASFDRTVFAVKETGCTRPKAWSTVRCLRRKPAKKLFYVDWVAEEISHDTFSMDWTKNAVNLAKYAQQRHREPNIMRELGWHAVVDNETLFGEPRELVRLGRIHSNLSVLFSFVPNETLGILPAALAPASLTLGLEGLLGHDPNRSAQREYMQTLEAQGIHNTTLIDLQHEMLTDKVFTCDIRSFAEDIVAGHGTAYVSVFAHAPKFAPRGRHANAICEHGAACHADDMPYILPQGASGIESGGPGMEGELAFSRNYSEAFLAFLYGNSSGHSWVPYNPKTRPITIVKASGSRVVPNFKKEQCDVLDAYNGQSLPWHMRTRRAT